MGRTDHADRLIALPVERAYAALVDRKSSADSDVVHARFVEVVPGDRVVQAIDFVSDDPAFSGTMTMTWRVEPGPGGTLVEIRADDVPVGISADEHAAGLASSPANLAAVPEGQG